MYRFIALIAGALAAACLVAAVSPLASARAGGACAAAGYSYAGYASAERVHGVAATLTALEEPEVASGHAAAWVGVGGRDAGPNGESEWLQVGLAAFPGSGTQLYYEVVAPGVPRRYVPLRARVRPGERHRVAVVGLAARPHSWRAGADG